MARWKAHVEFMLSVIELIFLRGNTSYVEYVIKVDPPVQTVREPKNKISKKENVY